MRLAARVSTPATCAARSTQPSVGSQLTFSTRVYGGSRSRRSGRLGLREAIDARYKQLHALLNERLGLEPAKETRTLYLELLGQS